MLASTRRYCPSQASCRASHAASVVSIRTPIICHAAPAATRELPPFSLGTQRFKKIIFLRHAESEQRSNCKDHDRPLSDGGRLQAIECAQELQARGWIPDLVLASNAKRTRETLDEMSGVISQLGDVDAHYYGSLYTVAALDGQTATHLQECLLEVVDDARHQCVLLVGHNKGWEEAASSFSGCAIKLKTASAALLQAAAASWAEVLSDDGQWQLVDVVTPASAT